MGNYLQELGVDGYIQNKQSSTQCMSNRDVKNYLERTGLFTDEQINEAILNANREFLVIPYRCEYESGVENGISLQRLLSGIGYPMRDTQNIRLEIVRSCINIGDAKGVSVTSSLLYQLFGITSNDYVYVKRDETPERGFDINFLGPIVINWGFFKVVYKEELPREKESDCEKATCDRSVAKSMCNGLDITMDSLIDVTHRIQAIRKYMQ
jgi:hypothetical protein